MSKSLSSINIRFFADLKQFSSQMQNANRKIKKFGRSMKKSGKTLSVGLTAPILALGGASVNVFADFEQSMAKVKAVSGATAKEFILLKNNALDLGASTRYTASEVSQLQLSYSKLGFSSQEILKVTNATLDLALATGEDLASSATVAASTLRGFGLEASKMQNVVDVMAQSFSSSGLDLEKFKTAMATVAPVAKNANVSLEQVTGYLSILVDRGVDASTAGTGLRNMFLELAKQGIPLNTALAEINNSTNKNATALKLFGKRGATVASIMAENIDEANGLALSYKNSEGAAKRMASIMDNTLRGSLFKLKSAFEALMISIGEKLKPIIQNVANRLSNLATSFKNLDDSTKVIIVKVGLLAAAIGPLLIAIGYLATNVVPGLISVFGVLRTAIGALNALILANPWTALAVAIGVVVAALIVYNSEASNSVAIANNLNDVRNKAAKSVAKEKAEIDTLLKVAKSEVLSKKDKLAAIEKLRKIAPDYLKDITLENINTDKTTASVQRYLKALDAKALGQAFAAKKAELYQKLVDEEMKQAGDHLSVMQTFTTGLMATFGSREKAIARATELDTLNKNKSISNIQEQISAINSLMEKKLEAGEIVIPVKTVVSTEVVSPTSRPSAQASRPSAQASRPSAQALPTADLVGIDPLGSIAESMPDNMAVINDNIDAFATKADLLKVIAQEIGFAVGDAFISLADGVINSLDLANNGFEGFIKGLAKTITKLIAMMLSSSIAQSISGATSSGAATGAAAVFTTPAFIATAVSGVIAAFAAIPKFEFGGIVGGNSFVGDKLLARVNSGEMILNTKQQNSLVNMLQPAGTNVVINESGKFILSGTDLQLVLDRTIAKNNRIR